MASETKFQPWSALSCPHPARGASPHLGELGDLLAHSHVHLRVGVHSPAGAAVGISFGALASPGRMNLVVERRSHRQNAPGAQGLLSLVFSLPTVCTCARAVVGWGGLSRECWHRSPAARAAPASPVAASQPPARPLSAPWRPRWLCGHPHPVARRQGLATWRTRPARRSTTGAGFACNGSAHETRSHWPWRGVSWPGAALSDTWVAPAFRRLSRCGSQRLEGIPDYGGKRAGLGLGRPARTLWGGAPSGVLRANWVARNGAPHSAGGSGVSELGAEGRGGGGMTRPGLGR